MKKFDLLPLWFFTAVYFVTCVAGLVMLLLGPAPIAHLYNFFSGVKLPPMEGPEKLLLFKVLFLPIISFALSFGAVIFGLRKLTNRSEVVIVQTSRKWAPLPWLYAFSVGYCVFSLWRGEAFYNFDNWFSHDYWIASRWKLFDTLTFFEFVNIYTVMPVLTSLLFMETVKNKRVVHSVLLMMIGILLSLLLFQKKQAIIFVAIVLLPIWLNFIYYNVQTSWKFGRVLLGVSFLYLLLVITPTLISSIKAPITRGDTSSESIVENSKSSNSKESFLEEADPGLLDLLIADESMDLNTTVSVFLKLPKYTRDALYFANSILFRTSVPAIFYLESFPKHYKFYGVDLPFDGSSPDDNRLVWTQMWPQTPGGSVMSSFQFSFYAQAGLLGSILLSMVAGAILGLLWWIGNYYTLYSSRNFTWCALVLVLAVHLAIDSARNSFFSAYGLGWGFVLLGLLEAAQKIQNRINPTHYSE